MAVIFSENVIEVAVIQEMEGRPVVNVWHLRFDGEWGTDTPTDVVEDFRNNWQDHITAMQTNVVDVLRFEWRSLDPGNAEVGVVEVDGAKPTSGVITGTSMPPNVAYLINKRTANRPRGARDGRMFLAGVAEALADARGTIANPGLGDLQADLTAFYNGISDISTFASGDRYPVVLETTAESRAPGTAEVNLTSRRVTELLVDPLVSTQRDRLR